jgi:hypothetical protein
MRWHPRFVPQNWDFSKWRRPGRPGMMREISQLIIHMAQENPWIGLHPNSRGVRESEPQRGSRDSIERAEAQWDRTCTRAQQAHHVVELLEGPLEALGCERLLHCGSMEAEGTADTLRAVCDWCGGPCRAFAGITTRPSEAWMLQMGRNLIDEC